MAASRAVSRRRSGAVGIFPGSLRFALVLGPRGGVERECVPFFILFFYFVYLFASSFRFLFCFLPFSCSDCVWSSVCIGVD